jgi:hypothetical protein
MAVPTSIYASLAALETEASAIAPLSNASTAAQAAVLLNAKALIVSIGEAQRVAGAPLDGASMPSDPAALPAAVLAVGVAAQDQWTLTDMLAMVSRADLNMQQEVA